MIFEIRNLGFFGSLLTIYRSWNLELGASETVASLCKKRGAFDKFRGDAQQELAEISER